MRRDEFFCLSSRRFAQPRSAALIMLTLTGSARGRQAIPITFPRLRWICASGQPPGRGRWRVLMSASLTGTAFFVGSPRLP